MTEFKRMRVDPKQKTKGDVGFTANLKAASPLNLMHGMQIRTEVSSASRSAAIKEWSRTINNFIEGAADETPGALLLKTGVVV